MSVLERSTVADVAVDSVRLAFSHARRSRCIARGSAEMSSLLLRSKTCEGGIQPLGATGGLRTASARAAKSALQKCAIMRWSKSSPPRCLRGAAGGEVERLLFGDTRGAGRQPLSGSLRLSGSARLAPRFGPSRVHLECISGASRVHLGRISSASRVHLGCISAASQAHVSPAVALTSKTPSSMESIVTSKVPARRHLEPSRVSVSGHLEESRGEASAPHLGAARASAQVVHQDVLLALSPSGLVEAVCDRGGGRLVDDAEHLKSRPPVPGPPGSSRALSGPPGSSRVLSGPLGSSRSSYRTPSRRHLGVISVPSHHTRHYRGIISALQIPRATLRPAMVPASLVAW